MIPLLDCILHERFDSDFEAQLYAHLDLCAAEQRGEVERKEKKLKPSFLRSVVSENNARFVINDMGLGVGLYCLIAECYGLTKNVQSANGFGKRSKTSCGTLLWALY
jgi:hypothetical protein